MPNRCASPECHLPAAFLPPSCHLPATFLPPSCHLPATFLPPSCHLPATFLPPSRHLPEQQHAALGRRGRRVAVAHARDHQTRRVPQDVCPVVAGAHRAQPGMGSQPSIGAQHQEPSRRREEPSPASGLGRRPDRPARGLARVARAPPRARRRLASQSTAWPRVHRLAPSAPPGPESTAWPRTRPGPEPATAWPRTACVVCVALRHVAAWPHTVRVVCTAAMAHRGNTRRS
jgi:hypothetical protein